MKFKRGVNILEIEYIETKEGVEIKGLNLSKWRHKNSVYYGSFYAKELQEVDNKLVTYWELGDRPFLEYRDKIHSKQVGWKTQVVDLVSSFMKVAYLVSRGVIYQPFEDPENYIYNTTKHRLRVVGRYDSTITHVDENFLDWVLEMVGFIISKERPNQFGYLTHQEYYDRMDSEHQKLYEGYLKCEDFSGLVEYTLESSVLDVLKEYVPITKLPIDNRPKVKDVLESSVSEKKQVLEKEKEELGMRDLHKGSTGSVNTSINQKRVMKGNQPKKVKSKKVSGDKRFDAMRERLGVPEDRRKVEVKRKGSGVLPLMLSTGFLAGVVWLAWAFYLWIF